MKKYPTEATERFDDAQIHIKYCVSFIKKYLKKKVLEIGAGCGSFTDNYYNNDIKELIVNDTDKQNLIILKKKYSKNKKIKVTKSGVNSFKNKFDTIIYLHVLEHIKEDIKEIENAKLKLKKGGFLVIIVPAHKKIYSKLDKAVGHYRRYEKYFFKRKFKNLIIEEFKYLDSMGYILYYLNKIFFKKEKFPSKLKIFIWDKIFSPLSIIFDFLFFYKFGKCIFCVFKKTSNSNN